MTGRVAKKSGAAAAFANSRAVQEGDLTAVNERVKPGGRQANMIAITRRPERPELFQRDDDFI
jgi:hypothetical protein